MVPFRHDLRTVTLDALPARIGIVSDTHSHPHPGALRLLAQHRPALVLHAGDIGDTSVLDQLETVAPVAAVRGNIDSRACAQPDALTVDLVAGAQRLRVLVTHIAVRGPRLIASARQLATEQQADLVVCGHSHMPLLARDGDLVVFNPGSCGPRRFGLPITLGLAELGTDGFRGRHLDCETEQEWTPRREGVA